MVFVYILLFACLFGFVLAIVIPLALRLMMYVVMFLAIVIGTALKFVIKGLLWVAIRTGKGLWWVVSRASVLAGRGIHFSALLLYFLIEEKLRGAREEQSDEEWDDEYEPSFDDEADEVAALSDLEAAHALFGLALTFTCEELGRAYKIAIRKAHPDLGGSLRQAQELNVARDLIMSAHGWA